MSYWYWTNERFASYGCSILKDIVGLSHVETYIDPRLRTHRFLCFFYYCDLKAREEREAAIGYDMPEEEIYCHPDPRMLLEWVADKLLHMKRQFNDFQLDADRDIIALLKARSCTEIRYFAYDGTYSFLDINGDFKGPVLPKMLAARIDYLAPLTPKYPRLCMGCKFLDKNPYLPCAINPMFATRQDPNDYCASFEAK